MSLVQTHSAPTAVGVTYYGLYPATVTALKGDPEGRQRIEVELPWLATTDGDEAPRAWAVMISPYADADQGFQMLPEIKSTVVVGFLAGHLDHPYVVGAVWNGNASAPEPLSDANDRRVIVTRSGSRLEFDDTDGSVAIRISTPGGHEIVMDDAGQSVLVSSSSGAKMELTQAGGVTIEAAATVEVTAAMVTVNASMSQFNGVVTCDTLIAKSGGVVSPMYTPGAGNVW